MIRVGDACAHPPPDPTAAAKPLWPWAIAAFVAWRLLRG
jgi:hypothetical protein